MKMAAPKCVVCRQLIWCFLLVAVAAQTTPTPTPTADVGPLWMEAKPDTIIPGLTNAFTVNCSLDNATLLGHPMDIVLYHNASLGAPRTRQKIASVSTFDPLEVTFYTPTTAVATCHFREGRYDMILHWESPQIEVAGVYECEGAMINSDVEYITVVKQADISYRTASLSDVVDHMQQELKDFKKQRDDVMMLSSDVINGHRYHLSTFPFKTVDRAEEVCQMVGGHLAVFQDDTELKNVVDFVLSLGYSSMPDTLVGIYQETYGGDWLNIVTGEPVSFLKWTTSSQASTELCAYLDYYSSESSWYYDYVSCKQPTSSYLFLCKSGWPY